MAIKVEKDVPIPAGDNRSKYPFAELEIGDSFTVEKSKYSSLRNLASYRKNRYGETYVVKVEGEKVRVWRTE